MRFLGLSGPDFEFKCLNSMSAQWTRDNFSLLFASKASFMNKCDRICAPSDLKAIYLFKENFVTFLFVSMSFNAALIYRNCLFSEA